MRFLIDNALPPRMAALLQAAGHDAVHVRTYGLHASPDDQILPKALAEDRIIVSADTDFATILALQEANRPSFILFRDPDLLRAEDYTRILLESLSLLESDLLAGCVAVFRPGRVRVRRLPFAEH